MRKLLNKPEEWSREIQTAFYEEFPFFMEYPISVNLVRKDLKRGFAVGNVTVTERFAVPVIIEGFVLKDFDVAMFDGKAIPLTTESIMDIFSNPTAFQSVGINVQDDKFNRLFSPELKYPQDWGEGSRGGMRYTKTAMLQQFLPYVKKEAQERVASLFDERDIATFRKHGTLQYLNDFISCTPMEDKDLEKIARENLSRDYVLPLKTGRNEYKVYLMNKHVDLMDEIDVTEDEYFSTTPKLAERYVLPEYQEAKITAKRAEAFPGSDGIISDGNTHIHIDIVKVATDENKITVIEGFGKALSKVRCEVGPVNKIEKIAENNYIIPKNFGFFELGLEGGNNPTFDTSNRVIKTSMTGDFIFQGPVFEKMGVANTPKKTNEALIIAVKAGTCAEDVEKIANLSKEKWFAFEESRLSAPTPFEEFLEKLSEADEKNIIDLSIIDDNLNSVIKIAAKVEEDYIVDKILALGAINDQTIKEFINFIPALEEVSSYLARLLILVRLGQKGLNESDVEQAMEALSKIIFHLKNIASTNKNAKELNK